VVFGLISTTPRSREPSSSRAPPDRAAVAGAPQFHRCPDGGDISDAKKHGFNCFLFVWYIYIYIHTYIYIYIHTYIYIYYIYTYQLYESHIHVCFSRYPTHGCFCLFTWTTIRRPMFEARRRSRSPLRSTTSIWVQTSAGFVGKKGLRDLI